MLHAAHVASSVAGPSDDCGVRLHAWCRHRMTELQTALRVVRALGSGDAMQGLSLSHKLDPATAFRQLDAACVGLAGHSYGALTVGALAAEDDSFACAISIDPWW